MVEPSRKKQFYPLIAVLVVFAVFGSLVFSKVELPNNFEICEKPLSKGAFAPFDYNIYWLAVDTSFIGKAKKNSSFALNGASRVLMPAGIQSTAKCLTILSMYTTNSIYFSGNNIAIPLKLRI